MYNYKFEVKKLTPSAIIPKRGRDSDAGYDLYADNFDMIEEGRVSMVTTGISIDIPHGYVGLIHPRSGLAAAQGITVVNAPGVVDSGYRGEVKVLLTKLTPGVYSISKGDRIAQIIFQRYSDPLLKETTIPDEEWYATVRNTGGFGSSGK